MSCGKRRLAYSFWRTVWCACKHFKSAGYPMTWDLPLRGTVTDGQRFIHNGVAHTQHLGYFGLDDSCYMSYSVYCEMSSNIPGLYSLDVISTSSCDNQERIEALTNALGTKPLPTPTPTPTANHRSIRMSTRALCDVP